MKTETKKKIHNRLKRVEGQVRGIGSMVDRDEYYTNIITQVSAVKSAMVSIENMIIENHLENMVEHIDQKSQNEILKIFNKRK